MTVDRGGLDYPITVEDHFSAGLKRFNAEVRESRRNMEGLVASSAKLKTPALRKVGKAADTQAATRASRNRTKALTIEEKALESLIKDEERRLIAESKAQQAATLGVATGKEKAKTLTLQQKGEKALAKEVERRLVASSKLTAAQRQGIDLSKKKVRALSLEEEILKRIAAAQKRLAIAQGLNAKQRSVSGLNAQEEVLKRIAATEAKLRVSRAVASSARLKELTTEEIVLRKVAAADQTAEVSARLNRLGRTADGAKRVSEGLKEVETSTKKTNSALGNLFFTFRRLIGVFAAFFIARKAAQGFTALVQETIRFNSALETANLGMAALVTAAGDVTDAIGQSVDPSQALALAQKEAARQTALLRTEGLKTAATFEQLVETFQTAVGPGLAAGLNLDEIRKFTVSVSQAASAIGVPQNQLSEEIRSILSGTIQQRTTRLAAVLGITNEEIRNLKEAGTLAEELQKKFEAFNVAGSESLKTFAAVFSNAKDAILQLLGAGGLEYFEAVKTVFESIKDAILIEDSAGVLSPAPGAVAIIKSMADGFEAAADEATRLIKAFDGESVRDLAALFGETLAVGVRVLGRLIEGVVKGLSDIALGIRLVLRPFQLLLGIVPAGLGDVISGFARAVVVIGSMVLAVKGAVAAWGLGALVLGKLSAAVIFTIDAVKLLGVTLAALSGTTLGPLLALVAGFAALVFLIKEATEETLGLKLSWSEFFAFGLTQVKAFGLDAWTHIRFFFKGLIPSLQKIMLEAFALIQTGFQNTILAILEQVAKVSNDAKDLLEELRVLGKENTKETERQIKQQERKLLGLKREKEAELDLNNIKAARETGPILADPEGTSTIDSLRSFVRGLLGDIKELAAGTKTFKELLEGLPPTIGKAAKESASQVEIVKRYADEQRRVTDALIEQDSLQGVTGIAAEVGLTVLRAEAQLRQDNIVLQKERGELLERSSNLVKRQAAIQKQIQESADTGPIRESIRLAEQILKLQRDRLRAEQEGTAESKLRAVEISQELTKLSAQAEDVFSRVVSEEDRARIAEALSLEGQQAQVGKEIRANDEALAKSRERNLALLQDQITLQARQASLALAPENRIAEVAARGQRAVVQAELSFAEGDTSRAESQSVAARARVDLLRAQTVEIESQGQAQIESLERDLAAADGLESKAALTELIGEKQKENTINLKDQNTELLKAEATAKRFSNLSGANGLGAALAQQSKDALAQLPSIYEQTFGLLLGITQAFSAAVSNLIVDAFDPNSDQTALERLNQFLKQVLKLIIDTLLQIAITKAVLNLGSLLGGGGGATPIGRGFISGNTGGLVSPTGIGYAGGGQVAPALSHGFARPSGLHPTDTVPAWLAPGENVIRRSSSNLYGQDVMRAINEGLMDPTALKALAGTRKAGRRRRKGMGYADGGVVSQTSQAASSSSPTGPAMAVVVPDQLAAARLFAGGPKGVARFFRENKGLLNTALGR